jgi:hypothetical protein
LLKNARRARFNSLHMRFSTTCYNNLLGAIAWRRRSLNVKKSLPDAEIR